MEIKPTNPEYFDKLIAFGSELNRLCHENNIQPVAYGSLAYVVYTHDQSIAINDIDFLVREEDFQKITDLVKTIPETSCEPTDYHSVKFFKDRCKIAFDSIEHYLKGIQFQIVDVVVNGTEFQIVDQETLKSVYRQGVENIPHKKEAYSYKLEKLSNI